jgi:hypothetical protein
MKAVRRTCVTRPIKARGRRGPSRVHCKTLVAAAMAFGVVLSIDVTARGAAEPYPCETPTNGTCAMQDVGVGTVMHSVVNVYLIFYGPWRSLIDLYIEGLVPALITDLNDSIYESTATTYYDSSGSGVSSLLRYGGKYLDTGSRGTSLTDDKVQAVINDAINGGHFPSDGNGIYLVLPDSSVTASMADGTPYCGNNVCGWNSFTPSSLLKYEVVGNPVNCPVCRSWNSFWQTPNNFGGLDTGGIADAELLVISHELNESLTDPFGSVIGWRSSGTTPNTQMADFCEGFGATSQGDTFLVSTPGGTAISNFHGGDGTDFLIQTLRVNANAGSLGYCANGYGGLFWDQNFGYSWTPIGDWLYGSYKGECESGQPLIGISTYTSAPQHAHAVMCGHAGTVSSDFVQTSSCSTLRFGGSLQTVQRYVDPPPLGDWDVYFYKGECALNEFVAGVAQSTGGAVDGLLCCPGAVGHSGCEAVAFDSSNVTSYDWDLGYFKAQCPQGQHVDGVSEVTTSGVPHMILCCDDL